MVVDKGVLVNPSNENIHFTNSDTACAEYQSYRKRNRHLPNLYYM